MRRSAAFLLETAVLAALLLAIGGTMLVGIGPVWAAALALAAAGTSLLWLPRAPSPVSARLILAGLALATALLAASGPAWACLVAAGLLFGAQRALAPAEGCAGLSGLAAALLLWLILPGIDAPGECFAWLAGLAFAAVPAALLVPAPRRPAPMPTAMPGPTALLVASQGAMALLMIAAPAGAIGCGITPAALAGGFCGHLAAMSLPGSLRAVLPRRYVPALALGLLCVAALLLLPGLPALAARWSLAGVSVGFAWGCARLALGGDRRGDLTALLFGVPLLVERAFAGCRQAARDGRGGIVLRVLLHADRRRAAGQQLDQLQRLVQP